MRYDSVAEKRYWIPPLVKAIIIAAFCWAGFSGANARGGPGLPSPPTVAITNPVGGTVFTTPANISISASASDTTGIILQVAFFSNATNQLGVVSNAPFTLTWTNATLGTNILTAVAMNGSGSLGTSAPVAVMVGLPGPPVFTLNASTYQVLENGGSLAITVQKNLCFTNANVNYSTANGSAVAVSRGVGNYQAVSGSLAFGGNEFSKTINIPIVYNTVYEGNTTFSFSLGASGDGSILSAPNSAAITIIDVNTPSTTNSVIASVFPLAVPAHSGQLQIVTLPPTAQGQWKLVWETVWHNSGDTLTGLPDGNYPVEFSPVAGYLQPGNTTNPVAGGTLSVATNTYVVSGSPQYGSLSVTILPSSVANAVQTAARGQWQLQGETNWHDNGYLATNLVAGDHIVVFKEISGSITPPATVVTVGGDQQNSIATTYLVAGQSDGTPPSVVQFSDATTPGFGLPYIYNGQLLTDVGYGSGCVVQPRVVLTAGHMLFNDSTLTYAQNISWFFQKYAGTYSPPAQTPAGLYMFSGYAAARTNDNSPGVESPTSQNLDVALLYFFTDAGRGGSSGYLVSDPNGTEWLQATALKTLVGYPVEDVSQNNIGKLHATSAGNLNFTPVADNVFSTVNILGYPGNSGGPLCVLYTNGVYYPAGVYLGGTANAVVRAIDGAVADLINRANVSAYTGVNHSGGVVNLQTGAGAGLFVTGNFQVLIRPAAAISNGAGWRITQLTSTNYFNANTATYALPAATYTVTFNPASGYLTPSNITLKVVGNQTATVNVTYPGAPHFSPPSITGGAVHLTVTAVTGQKYALERSTNLVTWVPLITNTVGADGTVTFSDTISAGVKRGFYRARLVP